MLIVLIGISILTFLLTYLSPGDPVRNMYLAQGVMPDEAQVAVQREEMGLNDPFLTQYFRFGESPDLLRELEGEICQIHVKDGCEGSMSLTPLGQGNGRFAECADVIRRSGYSGWIILENEFKAWGRDNGRLLEADIRTMKQAFTD